MDVSHLSGLIPVLIVIGLAVFLLRLLSEAAGPSRSPAPVAKPFMTQRERAMLSQIERILPAYRIHAQVAMGAILKAPSHPGRRPMHSDRNAFAQKIIDFVIEDPSSCRIVALIEVDDRSHTSDKDRARDAMTSGAGYRTLRIPAGTRPTFDEVLQVVGILRHAEPAAEHMGSQIPLS